MLKLVVFIFFFTTNLIQIEVSAATKEDAQSAIEELKSTIELKVETTLVSIEKDLTTLSSILESDLKSSEETITAYQTRYETDLKTYEEEAASKGINIEICLVYIDEIKHLSWETIKIKNVLTQISQDCQNRAAQLVVNLNSFVSVVEGLIEKSNQCAIEDLECFDAIIEETTQVNSCTVKKVNVTDEESKSVIQNGRAQIMSFKDSVLNEVFLRLGAVQIKTKECVDRKLAN